MAHENDHVDGVLEMAEPIASFKLPSTSSKRKTRSKVWHYYEPIFVDGKVQNAECNYCHLHLSSKESTGTSHLWRHLKICPARGTGVQEQQNDAYLPYVTALEDEPANQIVQHSIKDINIPISSHEKTKFKSKVWNEFTPVFLDGKVVNADCNSCGKRLSANNLGGRSHLKRHIESCPARRVMNLYLPQPAFKTKVWSELTPDLTNGKKSKSLEPNYSRKHPEGSSCEGTSLLECSPESYPASEMICPKQERDSSIVLSLPSLKKSTFDQKKSSEELARMIILRDCPLSIVEHDEFKRFAKSLNPMFDMVSSTVIEEKCKALFEKEKMNLKERIAISCARVSLSASLWTPDEADPTVKYLCLTAYFIDEQWKYHKRIIKFGLFWSSPTDLERMVHSNNTYSSDPEISGCNLISEAIRDWNLDRKLLGVTCVGDIRKEDNFSSIKEKLTERSCLPIKGKLFGVSCVDDVLNSIVQKGRLDILHLVGNVIEAFLLQHASSPETRQQLEVISQMVLKCPREDAKWWHKIYFRLELILQYKKAFPSEELMSFEEMKVLESVCKILRLFYRAIEVISGPNHPTSNLYFNELWKVRTILQEEASNDHYMIARMVKEMQEVFDELWQESYIWLCIPVVLDPRFKMGFIEFRFERAFGSDAVKYVSGVRDVIRGLFSEYSYPGDNLAGGLSAERRGLEMDVDATDELLDWDQHLSAQASNQESSEFDSYLEDALVSRKDEFDILNWWMDRSTKYPTLARMARDVLAMPASAVQSEAAFSCRGPVISRAHSSLSINTIEALICARNWIS